MLTNDAEVALDRGAIEREISCVRRLGDGNEETINKHRRAPGSASLFAKPSPAPQRERMEIPSNLRHDRFSDDSAPERGRERLGEYFICLDAHSPCDMRPTKYRDPTAGERSGAQPSMKRLEEIELEDPERHR